MDIFLNVTKNYKHVLLDKNLIQKSLYETDSNVIKYFRNNTL